MLIVIKLVETKFPRSILRRVYPDPNSHKHDFKQDEAIALLGMLALEIRSDLKCMISDLIEKACCNVRMGHRQRKHWSCSELPRSPGSTVRSRIC